MQEIEEEKPQEVTVSVIATVPDELLYSKKEKARFDKFGRFVRVTAWVLRAFRAFRSRLSKYKDEEKISSNATKAEVEILVQESKECNIKKDVKILVPVLSTEEIFFAERFCLRQIQMEAFKKDNEALSKGESIKHKSAVPQPSLGSKRSIDQSNWSCGSILRSKTDQSTDSFTSK